MLDRVLSLETAREGTGLKAVSAADCPNPESSPTDPVLARSLVLHGLCSLAELVLEDSGQGRAVLEGVQEAAFSREVRPGEVLTYQVRVEEAVSPVSVLSGEATVEGSEVARARMVFRWVETSEEDLSAGWRGLRRLILSGEDPPILR